MAKKKTKTRRNFGSGGIRHRGETWQIMWREHGQRHYETYTDEDKARKVLTRILGDIAAGRGGLARDPKDAPTLAELAKPWLERRQKTHRAGTDDRCRWRLHLGPYFGARKPGEVDAASIRRFIEAKLTAGLAASTVGHCIRLLSTFYADVLEQGHATTNPVASLPRSTRRLYRSTYDTKGTPFLQTLADVRRVFLALPEPYSVAFAVGALAGLRVGETLGLSWEDIDLAGRRIHVRQQMQDGRLGPLKDDEPRIVPILKSLAPIVTAWRLKTGGEGLLFKPANLARGGRPDLGTASTFIRPHTLHKHLAKAIKDCGLPKMSWYCCTRHTFASLFVLGGGSLELLRTLMGHASVTTTERYSHLRPDLFTEATFAAMDVDLSKPAGSVVSLPPVPGDLGSRLSPSESETDSKVSLSC